MRELFSGFTAEIFSGVALLFSGYTLWHTSIAAADVKVFVPPIIRYASPYQNSIFEVFEIPVTAVNKGAQTAAIISMNLEVTNLANNEVKRFYSAGLNPWSLAKNRGENLDPFAPIALAGRTSHSATILFYARNDSKVQQIVSAEGKYNFALSAVMADDEISKQRDALKFAMELPVLDHRAFTSGSGTISLTRPD